MFKFEITIPGTQSHLWLHIKQSYLVLLVNLVDGIDFGAKHEALEASILQQLVPGD